MSHISIGSAELQMPALSAALTTTEVRLEPRTEDAGKWDPCSSTVTFPLALAIL